MTFVRGSDWRRDDASRAWCTPFVAMLAACVLGACAATPPAEPVVRDPHSVATAATTAPAPDIARWEPDIAAFEARDRHAPPPEGGVVFVGSSSIRMWDTLARDFPGAAVVNRGFGGSRVRDSVHYADRIVTAYRPRAVALYAGDNDLAEGRTPVQVADDFKAFVQRVRSRQPDLRVAFIAIKPSPSRAALQPAMQAANQAISEYARVTPGVAFLDVHTPMLDANGQPRGELFLDDALHMNATGYVVWAGVLGTWLDGLPDATSPSR